MGGLCPCRGQETRVCPWLRSQTLASLRFTRQPGGRLGPSDPGPEQGSTAPCALPLRALCRAAVFVKCGAGRPGWSPGTCIRHDGGTLGRPCPLIPPWASGLRQAPGSHTWSTCLLPGSFARRPRTHLPSFQGVPSPASLRNPLWSPRRPGGPMPLDRVVLSWDSACSLWVPPQPKEFMETAGHGSGRSGTPSCLGHGLVRRHQQHI